MDTTKTMRLTKVRGSITTWENGPCEANAGHCGKLQISHDARWVGGKRTRADVLVQLAEQLELAALELRGMAKAE